MKKNHPCKTLSERRAAEYLGVHPATLMRWRQDGYAPPHYVYPGVRAIKYSLSELDEFLENCRRGGGSSWKDVRKDRFGKMVSGCKAAAYLAVHYWTLVRWRQGGIGPMCFVYPNARAIRYPLDELKKFRDECHRNQFRPGRRPGNHNRC